MSPESDNFCKDEVESIIHARVVESLLSAWSIQVLIATMKTRIRRFCVPYRALNTKIKGGC